MKAKIKPAEIWQEYEAGKNYNAKLNLYETVKQNENFFLGKQWEGLNAPDLDKPVLNFLRRVVTYFISMIVTDNVGVQIEDNGNEALAPVCDALADKVNAAIEGSKLVSKNRDILRDAAVDGDACVYAFYENDGISVELVDNTRVIFGNRYSADVQSQPYIIVVQPMILSQVKELAKKNGVNPDLIKSDYDEGAITSGRDGGEDRCTVLVKFWKDPTTGSVHYIKTTQDQVLKKETDLQYKLYPIAYMCWEKVKNSYHGQAALTGLIPNQIAVNKLWAMALRHQHMSAFPKVFYDRTKIQTWSNRVGEAIGVSGNPNEAVASNFRQADMSQQLVDIVERTITMTRDFMGASDAALGNVKPDNTSAIIAVQKASSAPLELQRLSFYQFVEDLVRVMIEIVRVDYPPIEVEQETVDPMTRAPITQKALVDLSTMDINQLDIKVDVGAAAYWSEVTQIQTLDNLFSSGILKDAVLYLESIPDNYIRNKNEIISSLKEQQAIQQQMMQQQMMGGVPSGMPAVPSGAAY